jgi:hypothetical protein
LEVHPSATWWITGHIAKNCPARIEEYKKRNNKRHHAYAIEDDEPPTKMIEEKIEDYVLFCALSGFFTWRGHLAHR